MMYVTDPLMRGSAVRRVQEMLQMLGYEFGTSCFYGEVDGIYGLKTEGAITNFQRYPRVGGLLGERTTWLEIDGICGRNTLKALHAAVEALPCRESITVCPSPRSAFGDAPILVDITATHDMPHWGRTDGRSVTIDSIVLHQTGCEMPQKPEGWGNCNAHYGITQEGIPIRVNPIDMMIWHAQRLSRRSIGIEIEGNYPGLAHSPNTLWAGGGGPHTLGDNMVRAAFTILEDICLQVNITHVYGHRQSSKNRRADPGEAIWRQIGIPFRETLGCSPDDLVQRFGDKSREIPAGWDDNAAGMY